MNAHMRRKLAKLEFIAKLQQPKVEEPKVEEKIAAPEPVVVEEVRVVEQVVAPAVVEETPAPVPVVPSGKKKKGV